MKIDETWFQLYEYLYGKTFNRLLTIGNNEKGYVNYTIQDLDELKNMINDFSDNEFYISLYNYLTEENILRWNADTLDKFEKFAEKKYIILRFRENSDVIQEEVKNLNEIQKFMFIRRSLNLGFNKELINEVKQAYNFFKKHFGIRGMLLFNGYNECLLIYVKDDLNLKNPSLTYYSLLQLLQEKLELRTLTYENIEPYAQLMPLPGTQNKHSRLYVQTFYPDFDYHEIMKNSQKKFFDPEQLNELKTSEKLHEFIVKMDNKIKGHEKDLKFDFEDLWEKI